MFNLFALLFVCSLVILIGAGLYWVFVTCGFLWSVALICVSSLFLMFITPEV
jgi:hypothetical protein